MDKLEITFEGIEFKPSQLRFPKYALIGTYGKAEAEEAMARLIEFSQKEEKWVAVSLEDYSKSIEDSIDEMFRANEIRQRNNEKRNTYKRERRRFKNRVKVFFGGTEIPEPVYEAEVQVPFSLLIVDPNAMVVGLRHLVVNNYLDKMNIGNTIYLKPTTEGILRLKKFVVAD